MRYLVNIQSTTIVFNTEINNMVHHVKRGDSSLQTALFSGNIEMVRLLLQWNADVNQANLNNRLAGSESDSTHWHSIVPLLGNIFYYFFSVYIMREKCNHFAALRLPVQLEA